MICNHCGAPLEEGVTLCPVCGTDNANAPETPVEEITTETAEITEDVEKNEEKRVEKEEKVEKHISPLEQSRLVVMFQCMQKGQNFLMENKLILNVV
jgi:uncharacterized Zn finger protein (UPF0148 family)